MAGQTGSCLCGDTRFTADVAGDAHICHCGMCRKWSGGAFIAVTLNSPPEFADGAPVGRYHGSEWGERVFCKNCGSTLLWQTRDGSHSSASIHCFENAGDFDIDTELFIDLKPESYGFTGGEGRKQLTEAQVIALFAPNGEG